MNHEKMTDKELDMARQVHASRRAWGTHTQKEVLAHIAALEAERGRWEQTAVSLQDSLTRAGAALRELTGDRDRLLEERGAIATNLGEARAERDTLGERVQALERDIEMERAECERASDSDDDHLRRLQEAESRLAAIRQRAGDKSALGGIALAHAEEPRGVVAVHVARFIVGAAPAPTSVCGPCEDGECCTHVAPTTPLVSGPTTTEAFAMQSEALDWLENNPTDPEAQACRRKARAALSLLELRMGAIWRTFCEEMAHWPTCPAGHDFSEAGWARCDCHMGQVRTTLTDAPPVFTLEEVRAALVAELASPDNCGVSYVDCCAAACDGMVKRLAALCR